MYSQEQAEASDLRKQILNLKHELKQVCRGAMPAPAKQEAEALALAAVRATLWPSLHSSALRCGLVVPLTHVPTWLRVLGFAGPSRGRAVAAAAGQLRWER